jgi:hypothetical protein
MRIAVTSAKEWVERRPYRDSAVGDEEAAAVAADVEGEAARTLAERMPAPATPPSLWAAAAAGAVIRWSILLSPARCISRNRRCSRASIPA